MTICVFLKREWRRINGHLCRLSSRKIFFCLHIYSPRADGDDSQITIRGNWRSPRFLAWRTMMSRHMGATWLYIPRRIKRRESVGLIHALPAFYFPPISWRIIANIRFTCATVPLLEEFTVQAKKKITLLTRPRHCQDYRNVRAVNKGDDVCGVPVAVKR